MLVLFSFVLVWFLQYRAFLNRVDMAWGFIEYRPRAFVFTGFLVLLVLLVLAGLTGRPLASVGILFAVVIIVTYIHINKMTARGFPLLPEDFFLASEGASLAKFIDFWMLVRTVLAAILAVGLFAYFERAARRWFGITAADLGSLKMRILVRVALIVVAIGIFIPATDFIRNHKGMRREDVEWLDAQFVAWNQVENYERNGFIIGFLYNLSSLKLEEPEGYSEGKIREIREKSESVAKERQGLISLADEKINVVVVLNESFYDPETIRDHYPYEGGEILPNLHKIQSQYPHGTMYSTDYGGGTANIEFEVLTGMTNYFANSVPYTDILPKKGATPSLASYFKDLGFGTTAIHPFNGSMYKRDIVLKNFGFERFITQNEMKYTEREGNSEYIKDSEVYAEALDILREGDENQFVALMTMQNHMPYSEENYETRDFVSLREDLPEEQRVKIETYYQTLHESDKYLGDFVAALDELEEPTVMLFFGDHAAGVFNDVAMSPESAVRDLSRMTPYFVYSNVAPYKYLKPGTIGGLPTITPNCLGGVLFNQLGARRPDFYYLTEKVCAETPILSRFYFGDEAPEMTQALKDYELVNYDVLGGERFWLKN